MPDTCHAPGCTSTAIRARGLCAADYERWRRAGAPAAPGGVPDLSVLPPARRRTSGLERLVTYITPEDMTLLEKRAAKTGVSVSHAAAILLHGACRKVEHAHSTATDSETPAKGA